MIIKCISLWDPWAWAMGEEIKCIETRGFYIAYRGWLGIQTALMPVPKALDLSFGKKPSKERKIFGERLTADGFKLEMSRPGHLNCIVYLEVLIKTQYVRANISDQELTYGNYANDRWAWKTKNLVKLPEPIPMKGKQSLWDWTVPPDVEKLLLANEPIKSTLF